MVFSLFSLSGFILIIASFSPAPAFATSASVECTVNSIGDYICPHGATRKSESRSFYRPPPRARTFNFASGGTIVMETEPIKTIAISSSTHCQSGRLIAVAMVGNHSPKTTIRDSSGNIIHSSQGVEAHSVNILFSDTGDLPPGVESRDRPIVLKTNETYYYEGSVSPDGGPYSNTNWFRMQLNSDSIRC